MRSGSVERGREAGPGKPENEPQRLGTLRDYAVLDTPPESDFDDLALLASRICGTPIALDQPGRLGPAVVQGARRNLDLTETPREIAFCAHAILQKDLFVVPDAREDARFSDEPSRDAGAGIRVLRRRSAVHARRKRPRDPLRPRPSSRGRSGPSRARRSRRWPARSSRSSSLRRVRRVLEATALASRQSEEALRASEAIKTRMIESSRDCIKVLDLEGRLLSMNAGGMETLEICDFSPVVNQPWIDFWQNAEDREAARVAVAAARAGQTGRFVGYFETVENRYPALVRRRGQPDPRRRRDAGAPARRLARRHRAKAFGGPVSDAHGGHRGLDGIGLLQRAGPAPRDGVARPLRLRHRVPQGRPGASGRSRSGTATASERTSSTTWPERRARPSSRATSASIPTISSSVFPRTSASWTGRRRVSSACRCWIASGATVGHIAILDRRPMDETALEIPVLKVFAARAGRRARAAAGRSRSSRR